MFKLTALIESADTLALTAPDPDLDALGALAALRDAILRRWPTKRISLCVDGRATFEARYPYLALEAFTEPVAGPFDLAVVVDGGPARLHGLGAAALRESRHLAIIDHHRTSPGVADALLWDADAASTTELILRLVDHWGLALDERLAVPLYAGLIFDTGGLRYRAAGPRVLRVAARLLETGFDHAPLVEEILLEQPLARLKLSGHVAKRASLALDGQVCLAAVYPGEANGIDTGGIVDSLVFVEGVEVGALLVERAPGRVKVSLRSRGGVDVAAVAKALAPSGGGHARAAGVTLEASAKEATALLLAGLAVALKADDRSGTREVNP